MKRQKEHLVVFNKMSLAFPNGMHLFHDLSLDIPEGSFHFLTGLSGVGKSTFLKLIYLDVKPSDGHVYVFGKDIYRITPHQAAVMRRKVGIVFQDFRLINHLTVLENVALPLKVEGIEQKRRNKEAAELLDWVGLGDTMHMIPSQLSGGQQQRVAIARAIVNRPRILLADEPTGNVDDQIAMRLMYLFEELHKGGTTIIVATHNQSLPELFPHPEIILEAKKASIRMPGEHTTAQTEEKKT